MGLNKKEQYVFLDKCNVYLASLQMVFCEET